MSDILRIKSFHKKVRYAKTCLPPCPSTINILSLRLKEYPRGLGKGFDAALLGTWLDQVVGSIGTDDVPDTWQDFLLS